MHHSYHLSCVRSNGSTGSVALVSGLRCDGCIAERDNASANDGENDCFTGSINVIIAHENLISSIDGIRLLKVGQLKFIRVNTV